LSNEPGYYREGAFGIRLENLIVVKVADPMGDLRDQLSFETLTFVPFDRRLIDTTQLSAAERAWLNDYHAQVLALLATRLSDFARSWAQQACAAL
jgi:Xaa-Pro aminopeptidase